MVLEADSLLAEYVDATKDFLVNVNNRFSFLDWEVVN